MIEITKILFYILLLLIFITSLAILIKQVSTHGVSTALTFVQMIKRSLIAGCMLSILVVSCFAALVVKSWNDPLTPIDFQALPRAIACIVIPAQIAGTVGVFGQLIRINSLITSMEKLKGSDAYKMISDKLVP